MWLITLWKYNAGRHAGAPLMSHCHMFVVCAIILRLIHHDAWSLEASRLTPILIYDKMISVCAHAFVTGNYVIVITLAVGVWNAFALLLRLRYITYCSVIYGGLLLQLKNFLFRRQLIYSYFVSMWSKYNALLMVESWINGLHCFCYTNLRPLQRTCHLGPILLKWFTLLKGMDTLLHSLIYMDMITHPCLNVNASLIEIPLKSGGWFNIKMLSYQYRNSHRGDKTILRPSYLHNGISYTGKMTSSYWIWAQDFEDNYEPSIYSIACHNSGACYTDLC